MATLAAAQAGRESFGSRVSAASADARQQRLLLMQKKMRLTEAIEKRMRCDSQQGAARPVRRPPLL